MRLKPINARSTLALVAMALALSAVMLLPANTCTKTKAVRIPARNNLNQFVASSPCVVVDQSNELSTAITGSGATDTNGLAIP